MTTWFKLKHNFFLDCEFVDMDLTTTWLWVAIVNYVTYHQTDGIITRGQVKEIAKDSIPDWKYRLQKLIKSTLLQRRLDIDLTSTCHRVRTKLTDQFYVKGYEKYNKTKKQIDEITEQNKVKASKRRGKDGHQKSMPDTDADTDADTDTDIDNINTKNINKDSMNIKDISIREIINYWCSVHSKDSKRYKKNSSTWNKIKARLNEGFTGTEIKQAIDGNAIDEWHKAKAKHELAYICRNDEKIHDFMARAEKNGAVKLSDNSFKPTPEELIK